MFDPGKLLQPSLMFAGVVKSLPQSAAPERCFTQIGSGKLARDEHFSLLRKSVNYRQFFYNIGPLKVFKTGRCEMILLSYLSLTRYLSQLIFFVSWILPQSQILRFINRKCKHRLRLKYSFRSFWLETWSRSCRLTRGSPRWWQLSPQPDSLKPCQEVKNSSAFPQISYIEIA